MKLQDYMPNLLSQTPRVSNLSQPFSPAELLLSDPLLNSSLVQEHPRHLQPGAVEAALYVERFGVLAAVEQRLLAAQRHGDAIERVEHLEPQPELLVLARDADLLNVADLAAVVDPEWWLVSWDMNDTLLALVCAAFVCGQFE